MDDNTARVLLAVVPAAVTGVVTYFVTRRSHSQFYTQRFWELKAKTYQDIFHAIGDIENCLEDWYGHFVYSTAMDDERKKKLTRVREKALDTLSILRGLSPFLIPEEVALSIGKIRAYLVMNDSLDAATAIAEQTDVLKANRERIAAVASRELGKRPTRS